MTPGQHDEPDVHLQVDLHGTILDFAARKSAAERLLADEELHHYLDCVRVLPGDGCGLPRLPCERLYIGPWIHR
ncbi:hypothetical protein ACFQZZ_18270 [Nocardia sp. GCM10030253]|uniref:hypothetical protein n=1 Tax=Nocardia sp. GCM10030253 TaxID=3273404 RepID=UPI003625E413